MTLHVRVRRARVRAGVERPLTLYGLRHTFITRSLEKGLTGDMVAAFAGAEPRVISMHYSHIGENVAFMQSVAAHLADATKAASNSSL